MSENGFFKNIPGITREKLQLNKRLGIFLIFIGIATSIWFLWTLEKEHTTVISSPVEFTNLPGDRVLVNELPTRIQLEVTGKGSDLLRHNWEIVKSPLRIDFKALHQGELSDTGDQRIVLDLSGIITRLTSQLPDIIVNQVIPDTISFAFARMVTKMIPVIADLDLELEKQYMVRGNIVINPDSIEVAGPSTIMDTIRGIYTNTLKLKKVENTIKRNLSLVEVHEKLKLGGKRVQVEIPVEQYTEKSLEVPVNSINVPDSLHLKIFPASAKLTFRVVVSEFEAIQPENFKLNVDYSKAMEGNPERLMIMIMHSPEYIENVRIHPETVGYILEK